MKVYVKKRYLLALTVGALFVGMFANWISIQWPSHHLVANVLGILFLVVFASIPLATVGGVIQALCSRAGWRAFLLAVTGAVCVMMVVIVGFIASLVLMFGDYDHFADELKLPEGVHLEVPVDMEWRERLSDSPGAPGDIRLYAGPQGGIYEADVWCNAGEAGEVYLRAFEITRGVELSPNRIPKRTCQKIPYEADAAKMLYQRMEFTIYEGNWGQYYGARIELWFRPDNGRQERKLLERNYKVEGWMR